MPGTLRFTREGVWLHQGEPITHEGIYTFFSRRLHWSEQHQQYVVEDGGRCVSVEVEDTPRVVRTIDSTATSWLVIANSGERELFDPGQLRYSEAGELYYELQDSRQLARLLRPAVQALAPYISADQGRYRFERNGISATLRPRNELNN